LRRLPPGPRASWLTRPPTATSMPISNKPMRSGFAARRSHHSTRRSMPSDP